MNSRCCGSTGASLPAAIQARITADLCSTSSRSSRVSSSRSSGAPWTISMQKSREASGRSRDSAS
jgi:hypothetical protein